LSAHAILFNQISHEEFISRAEEVAILTELAALILFPRTQNYPSTKLQLVGWVKF